MASVESLPVYLHPGVSVSQPPHLEGDPSLATEILPGPPPLGSIQQVGLPRKDHKKTSLALSYLPASDPGTTYPNHLASILPAAPHRHGWVPAETGSTRQRVRGSPICMCASKYSPQTRSLSMAYRTLALSLYRDYSRVPSGTRQQ